MILTPLQIGKMASSVGLHPAVLGEGLKLGWEFELLQRPDGVACPSCKNKLGQCNCEARESLIHFHRGIRDMACAQAGIHWALRRMIDEKRSLRKGPAE